MGAGLGRGLGRRRNGLGRRHWRGDASVAVALRAFLGEAEPVAAHTAAAVALRTLNHRRRHRLRRMVRRWRRFRRMMVCRPGLVRAWRHIGESRSGSDHARGGQRSSYEFTSVHGFSFLKVAKSIAVLAPNVNRKLVLEITKGASAFFTHRGEKLRGLAKGFTNVTPGAPHDSAASKWRICSLAASAMPRMWYNVRHDFGRQSKSVYHPALCGEAAATNITLQKESGSMARSTGEAVAEPL